MKNIILKTTVLFSLFLSLAKPALAEDAASAPYGLNEIAASQYARWISQIESPADVTALLPMSEKDVKLVNEEFEKSAEGFGPLKVILTSPTEIKIQSGSDAVTIGYQQFEKGVLFVNGKTLSLEKHKTFLNYRGEVEMILGASSASVMPRFSLISEAHAQSKNNLKNLTASIGVSNGEVLYRGFGQEYVQKQSAAQINNLEKVLIAAFKNESDRAKKMDAEYKRPAYFSAFTFTCSEKGQLTSVQDKMLVQKGKIDPLSMESIVREGQNFRYKTRSCDLLIDQAGKRVKGQKISSGCVVGENFFAAAPFYGFPHAAAQCCAKIGCAKAVREASDQIVRTHVKGAARKAKSAAR